MGPSGDPAGRLRAIRERVEKATPGPWEVVVKGNTVQSHAIPGVCSGISPKTGNAEFIAHAREDVPYLLDRIAELERERDATLAAIDALTGTQMPASPWLTMVDTDAYLKVRAALRAGG